ncbi:hypothetical protein EY643_01270 [Halioglobus maricola]|uniref:Na(+)-translocating NADH-quinone reductase subunit B n=1 Tax=Halioglobus maricola TaxID=2601894 RepID=A0A5P9NFU8_9GAMM|nr:DUF6482 family protein [Halioglobus maricola]QFU74389.1 hypothetical protein EY643_01270 [Halioglobus maricola]
MKISLTQLQQLSTPVAAIVYSLERSIYQVYIRLPDGEALLTEDTGKAFQRRNLQSVREALLSQPVSMLQLRQHSAYDEMIGQPVREHDNLLQLPLSLEQYP